MAHNRDVNNLTCPQRNKKMSFLVLNDANGKVSAILAKSYQVLREALVSLLAYAECRCADFISLPTFLKLHL